MILADIILTTIGVLALFVATITDLKKKEVPDWLSFSVIAAAFGIRLSAAIAYSDIYYLLYGLLGFSLLFLLGLLLYYGRLWGGGDTKLLMGLGALFGTSPSFVVTNKPFLIVLLINIVIVGSMYSLSYATFLYIKNFKRANREIKHQAQRMKLARFLYFLAAFASLVIFLVFPAGLTKVLAFSLALFLIFYIHLLIFIRAVEKVGMYKLVPVSKLTEGDWIAQDIWIKGKLVCSKKGLGLEKRHIAALKKANIKRVLIKEGVAFVPSFLIAIIITLFYGSLLF